MRFADLLPGDVIRPLGRGYAIKIERVYPSTRKTGCVIGTRVDYSEEKGVTDTRRSPNHKLKLWFWGGRMFTYEGGWGGDPKLSVEVVKDYVRRPKEEGQLQLFI